MRILLSTINYIKEWREKWNYDIIMVGKGIVGLIAFSTLICLISLLLDWLNLGLIERLEHWADNSKSFLWLCYVIAVAGGALISATVVMVAIGLYSRKRGCK
jgi:hypothetical protein